VENKEKTRLAKYLALYLARFQEAKYGLSEERPRYDIFWPFNFVWFVAINSVINFWKEIFKGRRI